LQHLELFFDKFLDTVQVRDQFSLGFIPIAAAFGCPRFYFGVALIYSQLFKIF
jgi:hypothetical protein